VTVDSEMGCYTRSNLIESTTAVIHFQSPPKSWGSSDYCFGTAVHEILHALGFQHEHQRSDRDEYLKIPEVDQANSQYRVHNSATSISPFDSHSIMLYHSTEFYKIENGDPIYFLMGSIEKSERRSYMSPIDRICLNYIWPPARRSEPGFTYQPKISTRTGLYYCGRNVTSDHNYPAGNLTNGFCGPNNGPNCDACRVLHNPKIPQTNVLGVKVWQGSSGLFYCGVYFRKVDLYHDGYCGPNNGRPCDGCYALINN